MSKSIDMANISHHPMTSLPRWRPWRELAVFNLMVMELCWVVPWYRSLTRATYATPPLRVFGVLGSLLMLTHFTVRFMSYLRLNMSIRRILLIILLILCALIAIKSLLYTQSPFSFRELLFRPIHALHDWEGLIPEEFLIVLVVLFIGWRGIVLAQQLISPQAVVHHFQTGIMMFLLFIILNTLVTGETLGWFPYPYLFSGLIAMGAARISVLGSLRGGPQTLFDRRWALGMILTALIIVSLASLVAQFAIRTSLFQFVMAVVLTILALLTIAIASPFIFFLPYLLEHLKSSSETTQTLISALETVRTFLIGTVNHLMDSLDQSGIFTLASRLKPLLFWSILSFACLLVISSLSRWLWKDRIGRKDELQSLLDYTEFVQNLRELMQNQLKRVEKGRSMLAHLRYPSRLLATVRIRRIYTHLMELSMQLDTPRHAAQTPLEYLPSLHALFPDQKDELDTITQAYLQVRYGEVAETSQEVEKVEAAWQRVKTQGQQLLASRRKMSGGKKDTPSN